MTEYSQPAAAPDGREKVADAQLVGLAPCSEQKK
jgi:hypothetical protein